MEKLTQINKSVIESNPAMLEQPENKTEQRDSIDSQEPSLLEEDILNAETLQAAIHEQTVVASETARLDAMSKVRERLGMPTLINADSTPLSDIGKLILEKKQKGENLTVSEAIRSGRDRVFRGEQIPGITIKPDHAYRNIDEETLRKYIQSGSVEGDLQTPDIWSSEGGNKGVDWYLGGLAPKYGNYCIETPADSTKFVVADQDSKSLMAQDPFVRHIKSEGGTQKSIPMSVVDIYKISINENGLVAEKIDPNNLNLP